MKGLFHFLQYHNAIPIALGVIVIGSGAAFAATNPEAIYTEQQEVISIDNTYIANKDLEVWTPQIRIGAVTEDEANYHVAYALSTIDLDGYAWRDVTKNITMSVSKADLGQYRDLGVYVTQQLRQIIDRELQRLRETQAIERQNVSQATIATAYGGLVGALLTDSTETLPGYVPVVTAPSDVVAGSFSGPDGGAASAPGVSGAAANTTSLRIGLQVLGNNPARIPLGAVYADLGAVLIDPYNTNVGVHTFVDGREVITPSIDTSTTTSYIIEYRATDPSGADIMVRRVVIVGDASDPGGHINEAGNVAPVQLPQDDAQPDPAPTQSSETQSDTGSATSSVEVGSSTTSEAVATTTPETATSTPRTDVAEPVMVASTTPAVEESSSETEASMAE